MYGSVKPIGKQRNNVWRSLFLTIYDDISGEQVADESIDHPCRFAPQTILGPATECRNRTSPRVIKHDEFSYVRTTSISCDGMCPEGTNYSGCRFVFVPARPSLAEPPRTVDPPPHQDCAIIRINMKQPQLRKKQAQLSTLAYAYAYLRLHYKPNKYRPIKTTLGRGECCR